MKTIIVAYDKNYGIGANNDLLWQRNLPADLKHFSDYTRGNAVIMGYNTYRSIVNPLPNRQNIIISDDLNLKADGFLVTGSLSEAYGLVDDSIETYIIGGGYIYSLAIDDADRIIATEVDHLFENATVFFPKIDKSKWREVSRAKNFADDRNLYDYDFVIYERIS